MRIGYACINLTLGDEARVNRTMRKATFKSKGLKYVSELAFQNICGLEKIVKWNVENNMGAYRMSSAMFPWLSEYEYKDLSNYELISNKLFEIGEFCRKNNHRLSLHPGPFNILASPRKDVVNKTIKELNDHSKLMNMMGFNADNNTKINIHIGGAYGDKKSSAERFCNQFDNLNEDTKKRLTVENDDKESMFTTKELYDLIYKNIKIPIVFDYLHHELKNDGMSEKEALDIACSTWGKIQPVVHFASSKKIHENLNNEKINSRAHADYIYNGVKTYNKDLCIIFESKAKDLSVLKFNENYKIQ